MNEKQRQMLAEIEAQQASKRGGTATAQVDTSPEGTRMLVELGLISLLEKAIDAENTEYTIKDGLHE